MDLNQDQFGPLRVGIPHSAEAVEHSQERAMIGRSGERIPLEIHELPHELRERTGVGNAAGRPIDITRDERIPSHVYHVTTAKDAVMESGHLKMSPGGAGLGGHHAPVVSMTTDRKQAMQIYKDLKLAGTVAQRFASKEPEYGQDRTKWGTGLVNHLQGQAHKEGWEFSGAASPVQLKNYGAGDWMNHFHQERWSKHPQRHEVDVNPVILGEGWRGIDPKQVGVVRVRRSDIARTGSLVTDFDLRKSLATQPGRTRYGASEIRAHGDVPIRPPTRNRRVI